MKLTRIESLSGDRVRLHLTDTPDTPVVVPVDLLLETGLAAGDTLSAAELERIQALATEAEAREAALSLLAHRARSREELRRRLRRKQFPDPAIASVLAWLDQRGYVDDAAFAEAYVRDRLRLRPRGRFALARELAGKGVAADVAAAAIDAVLAAEDADERDLALAAADAWARRNRAALRRAADSSDARQKARRRLYAHLARRGFSGDDLSHAMGLVLPD